MIQRNPQLGPTSRGAAFTLVELMISIALALLLIVGINKVFQISSQTVGAGQALSTISRDDRTAHTIIYADVQNAVIGTPKTPITQSPLFYIACSNAYAFRNAADQQSDNDQMPGTTNGPAGTNPTVDATAINDRSHRTDVIGFLASGNTYARQTANDGQYVSPTTSSEAFIWYGHMAIPNNAFISNPASAAALIFGPGAPSGGGQNNDNNFVASDWIVGRMAMLLGSPATNDIYIRPGASGNPLASDAVSLDGKWSIGQSRYDIAAIQSPVTPPPPPTLSVGQFATLEGQAGVNPALTAKTPAGFRDQIIWVPSPPAPQPMAQINRFTANPFVAKPLTSAGTAQATPIFIRSCSQFIVEFAGDYISQDPTTGAIAVDPNTNMPILGPDGNIDFVIDSVTGQKKVRWYGFPRDINGDGKIDTNDVVPLRDIRPAPPPATNPFPCERYISFPQSANYAGQGAALNQQEYVCSWGTETTDPLPKMIRITIALDDPNGRLASPQFFEYVIDLTK